MPIWRYRYSNAQCSANCRWFNRPILLPRSQRFLARLKPTDAQEDLLDLLEISYHTLASPAAYLTALDLAMRYQHHLFDTLYHAVALHTPGAVLITDDKRYYNKVRLEGQIILLADFEFQGQKDGYI
jgi:hypothetical protein